MTLREKLMIDAERFCEKQALSLSRFSTVVVNDSKFFTKLRSGRDCTTKIYERFQEIFNNPMAWEAAKFAERQRRRKTPTRVSNDAESRDDAA